MVLVRILKVLDSFSFRKNSLKKVFGAFLDRKYAILDYKDISLRKSDRKSQNSISFPGFFPLREKAPKTRLRKFHIIPKRG